MFMIREPPPIAQRLGHKVHRSAFVPSRPQSQRLAFHGPDQLPLSPPTLASVCAALPPLPGARGRTHSDKPIALSPPVCRSGVHSPGIHSSSRPPPPGRPWALELLCLHPF